MDAALVVPVLALLGVIGAAIVTQRSARETGNVWKDLNGELRLDRDYWRARAIECEEKLGDIPNGAS